MTPQEILENNRKIAEFLGHESEKYVQGHIYFGPKEGNYAFDALKYHNSWDWLMHVTQRIEGLGFTVTIAGVMCKVTKVLDIENPIVSFVLGDKSRKLELVYLTLNKFIDWYNSQQNPLS